MSRVGALFWYLFIEKKGVVDTTPPPIGGFPSFDFTDARNTAFVAAFYI